MQLLEVSSVSRHCRRRCICERWQRQPHAVRGRNKRRVRLAAVCAVKLLVLMIVSVMPVPEAITLVWPSRPPTDAAVVDFQPVSHPLLFYWFPPWSHSMWYSPQAVLQLRLLTPVNWCGLVTATVTRSRITPHLPRLRFLRINRSVQLAQKFER